MIVKRENNIKRKLLRKKYLRYTESLTTICTGQFVPERGNNA
jgi:hypothetical protein